MYKKYGFEHTIVNQGFYIPQGLEVELAKKHKSHLVVWDAAYRKCSLIMSHDNTYFRLPEDQSIEKWKKAEWNDDLEADIVEYLESRWQSKNDWRKFLSDGTTQESHKKYLLNLE